MSTNVPVPNVPIHWWNMIRRMQHLSETLQKEVLESVVKRDAYYAHQENVLIAMVSDKNVTTHELGFWRILKPRQESKETSRHPSIIRQFKVPEINIKAENYTELLYWESDHHRMEPPITMAISKEELFVCIKHEKKLNEKLFDFHAKLNQLNEASLKVNEKDSRDGLI